MLCCARMAETSANASDTTDTPSSVHEQERAVLAEAERAFDVGDYLRVRQITDTLREAHTDDISRAARDLRRRVAIDPAQIVVLLGCLAVFLVLVYMYVPL